MSSVKPASPKTKAPDTGVMERLGLYFRLVRLDRPIGILLLLWPTLWALWIAAGGFPGWTLLLVFTVGTVLTRSAGCAVNDFADRHIDLHVERTRERPLTSGRISAREALLVAAALALLAFMLLFFTNGKTMLMSLVAVFLAVIYPFSKRFTHLPQVFLGAAFSWGIPMAYTAVDVPLTHTTWLLFIASVLWALVYDTLYAMVDREDDLKIGVKSTAILFGDADVVLVTGIHVLVLLALVLVGSQESFGLWYNLACVAGAAFIVRQYFLVRGRQRGPCFKGFLDNNYFGMVIFAGIVAEYLLNTSAA